MKINELILNEYINTSKFNNNNHQKLIKYSSIESKQITLKKYGFSFTIISTQYVNYL